MREGGRKLGSRFRGVNREITGFFGAIKGDLPPNDEPVKKKVVVLAEATSDIERGIDFGNSVEDGAGLDLRASALPWGSTTRPGNADAHVGFDLATGVTLRSKTQGSRIKDLGDISRLVESHPELWPELPPDLQAQIEQPV